MTLQEKLEFDAPGGHRTAHTEGRMFGLTFWENWYLIGENSRTEPDFKFVYYTGKTLQNRYEGAFVYARKPELPKDAMPSIYRIAREAGLDPTRACCIDNTCFDSDPAIMSGAGVGASALSQPQPPPFTPVASAGELQRSTAADTSSAASAAPGPLRMTLRDVAELVEDPKPPAEKLFARQRPMYLVREFDANGYRVPSSGLR
jgi:hypothetical protein